MADSKSNSERLVKAFTASIGIQAKLAPHLRREIMGYYVGPLHNRALSSIRCPFVYGATKDIVWRKMLTDLLKTFGKTETELEVLADISGQDC